jgi:hypothetical protein
MKKLSEINILKIENDYYEWKPLWLKCIIIFETVRKVYFLSP